MIKKILISIILFYFLALIQTSFLVHFAVWGLVPNIILFLIIIWNLFEKPSNKFGFYQAFIAGFFLDIFSNRFIGFNILILLITVLIIKFIFKRYVKIRY